MNHDEPLDIWVFPKCSDKPTGHDVGLKNQRSHWYEWVCFSDEISYRCRGRCSPKDCGSWAVQCHGNGEHVCLRPQTNQQPLGYVAAPGIVETVLGCCQLSHLSHRSQRLVLGTECVQHLQMFGIWDSAEHQFFATWNQTTITEIDCSHWHEHTKSAIHIRDLDWKVLYHTNCHTSTLCRKVKASPLTNTSWPKHVVLWNNHYRILSYLLQTPWDMAPQLAFPSAFLWDQPSAEKSALHEVQAIRFRIIKASISEQSSSAINIPLPSPAIPCLSCRSPQLLQGLWMALGHSMFY